MGADMIKIRNLRKNFGTLEVLKGIDLDVSAGDVAVLIGPSGCGKSTLLRCLNLLEEPTAGKLEIAGRSLEFDGKARVRERQRAEFRAATGMVFQSFNLFPHMTVLENVMSGPLFNGILGKKDARDLAASLLDRVGLGHRLDLYPRQISGGQSQRVAIARALVHRPMLLLADEPTGNLDPGTAARVMDALVEQTRQHGAAMVLVTHSVAAAKRADRVLTLTATGLVDYLDAAEIRMPDTPGRR